MSSNLCQAFEQGFSHRRTVKKAEPEMGSLIESCPVTCILGPRQCGKTTISKEFKFDHYYDLENPRDLARLDHPQLALEDLKGLIVIDEIQRKPDLFSLIRFLVDNIKPRCHNSPRPGQIR